MAVKVRKRKELWWVYIDHNNKRKAKCIGPSKRAADQVAEKIRAKLALGQFSLAEEDAKQAVSFANYYDRWLNTYVAGSAKPSTMVAYECVGRLYLLPAFGDRLLRDIAPKDVRAFAYGLVATQLKRNTIMSILIPLSSIFRFAVKDELLLRNPAGGIAGEIGSAKQSDQRPADFLTKEELGALLRCCQEYLPVRYPFISLLAKSGLRIGEALALEWVDIDFDGRFYPRQQDRRQGSDR